nr:MAG TPA: PROTEIN/RNA Complex, archaeal, ribosomal, 50S, protein.0A [Caudoviricetes sp.]
MTREEAIKVLNNFPIDFRNSGGFEAMEALKIAILALRPVSREQVEKVWRGVWKHYLPPLGAGNIQCRCTKCGRTPDVETPFCAWCGAPMTDEAVEMVMERMEELKDATD